MRTLFLSFLLLYSIVSSGQNATSVSRFSYQHTVSFYGSEAISRIEDLFYNGKSSVFVIYGKDLSKPSSETSVNRPGGGNVSLTMNSIDGSKDLVIYKNYENGLMVSREFIDNGDFCIVNDTIPTLAWQMTSEKKTIGTYKCQKATTSFRCANYVAWFTTDIPFPIGPWKISGLPGLIVQLIDERSNVTYKYSLLTAEYPTSKVVYKLASPNTKEKVYSFDDYSKIQLKEIEKKRIFNTASAEDPISAETISARPECYEKTKK
jgi:GLPGLI family protein